MEFRILGPLEAIDEGRALPLGGAKQRALLAILLTRANEVVSSDRLIDELWGAEPPATAANTLQYYVSQLRKTLGAERIATRPPGYLIRVEPGELDLERFEELLRRRDGESLHAALALWRGAALADFVYEPFAQSEIARLEELRLVTVENRIDADLDAGRHAELVAELERLVAEHPLRERPRAQLMLALYRSGRQAEALASYQTARRVLVEELGIEPGPVLQELERAILRQDPSLALPVVLAPPARSILVALREGTAGLEGLIELAEPLARKSGRELILVMLVGAPSELGVATNRLNEERDALAARGVTARGAAFTSDDAGADLVRTAEQQDVDLVLLEAAPTSLGDGPLPPELERLLVEAPCDVALVVRPGPLDPERPVIAPFGGAEHDWAAVEVAAWAASAMDVPLQLLGSAGGAGKRDASRLLGTASLIVQRALGVRTEPVLVATGAAGIVKAAADGALIVVGLSDRWRQEGLGDTRLALAQRAKPPMLFVKRGLRPSGVAPQGSLTRFTWSLAEATH